MRQLSDLHTGDRTPVAARQRPRRRLPGRSATGKTGACFDTLAQFYRKAYLRWINATSRRSDVRAARIVEAVDLLAAGIKERPRS
jgi:hypothetical protein